MSNQPDRSDLRNLQDKTAIVGVGTTEFGAIYRDLDPERSAYELGLIAFREALKDAGLRRTEVDGVIVSRLPHYGRMCEMIGLRHPRFVNVLPGEGRQSGIALQYAALAVANGMADVVACIYGNNGRSAGAKYGGESRGVSTQAMFEAPYGMTSPGAVTSMMFRRHQYRYGTTTEPLGHLAISNRANAALNPNAVMQRPITMDDYHGARYIAEPLCLFDYLLDQRRRRLFHRHLSRTRPRPQAHAGADSRYLASLGHHAGLRCGRLLARADVADRRRPVHILGRSTR